MFRIGQKVVCVDDTRLAGCDGTGPDVNRWISAGQIYTIRKTTFRKSPLVWLQGVNRACVNFYDSGFHASRFRPVVEKKTDISVFTEILNRETVDDRAPARVR